MMTNNGYFNTPPVVKNLIIANAVCLLALYILPSGLSAAMESHMALFFWQSRFFHSYQIVTHMFLHANFMHFFMNMFALWMFGRSLEYELGSRRFLIYYMVCGIGAALMQLGVNWIEISRINEAVALAAQGGNPMLHMQLESLLNAHLSVPMVGASGAVFGVLLAFGMMHPNDRIYLMFFPVPIKAKWFVLIYGAIELFSGVSGRMDNVAHFAHVGGMLWGFLLLRYWKRTHKIYY